jgi:hypothetical protein
MMLYSLLLSGKEGEVPSGLHQWAMTGIQNHNKVLSRCKDTALRTVFVMNHCNCLLVDVLVGVRH